MTGTDEVARALRAMRFQGYAGLVVAACCGAWAASRGSAGWLAVAGLAAALGCAVLLAARVVGRGGRHTAGVAAEFAVLLFGAWAWQLFPLTVAVPVYVLFVLGRNQPQ